MLEQFKRLIGFLDGKESGFSAEEVRLFFKYSGRPEVLDTALRLGYVVVVGKEVSGDGSKPRYLYGLSDKGHDVLNGSGRPPLEKHLRRRSRSKSNAKPSSGLVERVAAKDGSLFLVKESKIELPGNVVSFIQGLQDEVEVLRKAKVVSNEALKEALSERDSYKAQHSDAIRQFERRLRDVVDERDRWKRKFEELDKKA